MVASPVERILTSPEFFGLTSATPVQRAWCRALDGVPLGELWEDPRVQANFGGALPAESRPREVVACAGDRTGKSMILAALCVHRARNAALPPKFEREAAPIVPIISIQKTNAGAVLEHVLRLVTRPKMRSIYVGARADRVVVRNKTGVPIPIQVIANRRDAASLASRWHVVTICDESFLIPDKKTAIANLDDVRVMARKRLLKGGQLLFFGAPWAAWGPAYDMLDKFFGASTEACLAMHTDGPSMNPEHWTPEFMAALRDSKDQADQDAYVTGGLGQFLDLTGGLLAESEISRCLRAEQRLPLMPGRSYTAFIDPATRRNAWTLVVAHREDDRIVVDVAGQWIPTAGVPLDPDAVIAEIVTIVGGYGLDTVWSDKWSNDALAALARHHGLTIVEYSWVNQQHAMQAVVDGVRYRRCDLPRIPELKRDLCNIVRKMTSTGPHIVLRDTPDGRHADFAPPLAMAWEFCSDVQGSVAKRLGRGLPGDAEVEPPDPEDMFGVLGEVESSALDSLF